MKKIIILLFLSSLMFAQQPGWRTVLNTNINVSGAQSVEMFSNSFGNNIILQNTNGSITYYVMNTSTGQAGNAISVETSGASLANITGDASNVYVVYKKNNVINCKYTTNAGANWTSIDNYPENPTYIDVVYDQNGLHVAYTYNNIARYRRYIPSGWGYYQSVSETETGTNPRIESLSSENKIYVVYQNGSNAKSREYNVSTNSWGDRKTLYSNLNYPTVAGLGVDANYLYIYYSAVDLNNWHYNFYSRIFRKSDHALIDEWMNPYNSTNYIQTTTTADNKVHTAYYWEDILEQGLLPAGVNHFYFDNGTRYYESIYQSYGTFSHIDIASSYNDLYSIWKNSSSNYLSYRQYDAYPSIPQNLSLTANGNNNPVLSWAANKEADFKWYRVYKKLTVSGVSATTSFYTTATSYTDNDFAITNPRLATDEAEYWVVALDLQNNVSPESEHKVADGHSFIQWKLSEKNVDANNVENFALYNNYPNPFNPTTNIIYSVKEDAKVVLKVYDVLGTEVAELVNETKPAGFYEVSFNASNLSSGMYIYRMTALKEDRILFSESKRMLLMK